MNLVTNYISATTLCSKLYDKLEETRRRRSLKSNYLSNRDIVAWPPGYCRSELFEEVTRFSFADEFPLIRGRELMDI